MKNYYRIFYLGLLGLPAITHAAPPTLENLDAVGKGAGFQQSDIRRTLMSIVQILLGFIGLVFFIFILWGGVQWMTSGGNEKKIEDAKKRIVNATIGLTLIMMSYAIARSINLWLAQAVSSGGTTSSGGSTLP